MGQSLNPSPLTRLWFGLRPDWTRTVAARRAAAGGLVVLAAVAALRPDPSTGTTDVVVAARDLTPGVELGPDDVSIESRSATTVPDGFQTAITDLVGSTLAGPARRGEVLTDVRLLSPRLAEATAGPDARIVPLHLADGALLELVRPGDVVDVLAVDAQGGDEQTTPRVLARGAVVVLTSATTKAPGGGEGVVLVALPAQQAVDAAAASLSQAVTLTFH
ncbi:MULTISPECIES: SAF domain-containing protein [unclassified Mycobacterium]|uniref:SAF domain-containing protein n=1 Tax=unclassified Mycobacterium TaxID=2642494 RepID=UPI0029C945F5|nr:MULTISPECIES: SAF domain-containing protein [unclassified Mycobacterium]